MYNTDENTLIVQVVCPNQFQLGSRMIHTTPPRKATRLSIHTSDGSPKVKIAHKSPNRITVNNHKTPFSLLPIRMRVPSRKVPSELNISQITERISEFVSTMFYTTCKIKMKKNTSAISQSITATPMTTQARRRSINSAG